MPDLTRFGRAFWDERYRSHTHVWSGRPNPQLVAHAQTLTPGRALDVGCGEGADAIWLAQHGWAVTAIDVSPVALEKAAAHAARTLGPPADAIRWREADLFATDAAPWGTYELVSSQYLHMPAPLRPSAFARLAGAVAFDGHLLLVSHHPSDLDIPGLRPQEPEMFYTPEQLVELLDAAAWTVVHADAPARGARTRDGREVTAHDTVLLARRRVR